MTRRHRPPVVGPEVWGVLGLGTSTAPELVDARPVREHAQRLVDRGWGSRGIAVRAGVHRRVVQALLHGRTRYEPPSRRVTRHTRDSILSIRLTEVPPCQQR